MFVKYFLSMFVVYFSHMVKNVPKILKYERFEKERTDPVADMFIGDKFDMERFCGRKHRDKRKR